MNVGHFVRVWTRLCVFISTAVLHFKREFCRFWVSRPHCVFFFFPQMGLVNINDLFRFFELSFKLISICSASKKRKKESPTPKVYLNKTASVIMPSTFFSRVCGYLNYNLWFQRLYRETFSEVFHSHGFSSREITGVKWSNEFLYMCQL